MSKSKLIGVIDKKIRDANEETRKMEKTQFKSGQGSDIKDFIHDYLNKRKEFHKYNIYNVKVNQA